MSTEAKYVIAMACLNLIAPPLALMIASWSFEPKIILPMMFIGMINAAISLLVFKRWAVSQDVYFITKETVVNVLDKD